MARKDCGLTNHQNLTPLKLKTLLTSAAAISSVLPCLFTPLPPFSSSLMDASLTDPAADCWRLSLVTAKSRSGPPATSPTSLCELLGPGPDWALSWSLCEAPRADTCSGFSSGGGPWADGGDGEPFLYLDLCFPRSARPRRSTTVLICCGVFFVGLGVVVKEVGEWMGVG